MGTNQEAYLRSYHGTIIRTLIQSLYCSSIILQGICDGAFCENT